MNKAFIFGVSAAESFSFDISHFLTRSPIPEPMISL
jgi:hypothetical protein